MSQHSLLCKYEAEVLFVHERVITVYIYRMENSK
jgi:hypothetical protein